MYNNTCHSQVRVICSSTLVQVSHRLPGNMRSKKTDVRFDRRLEKTRHDHASKKQRSGKHSTVASQNIFIEMENV